LTAGALAQAVQILNLLLVRPSLKLRTPRAAKIWEFWQSGKGKRPYNKLKIR